MQRQRRRHDASLQYGGETFLAASAFARLALRRRYAGRRRRVRTWPLGAWATLRVLARMPRIEVSLTDSPSGRVIDAYLRERNRGVRSHLLARGVLTLPRTSEEYLTGRSRRAVRTNRSHADNLGVSCVGLFDGASAQDAIRRLTATGLIDNPDVLLARTSDDWLIALDQSGEVVGGGLVTIDRYWAMLNVLVGSPYPVRYALHTDLVLTLADMGVQHLFAANESALLLPPGLQYLQRILGYQVVNLRL
jgi:hypothetical protein